MSSFSPLGLPAYPQKISQLEYEVDRAFEQYNEVDPCNRLVASVLEKRWNKNLIIEY